MKTREELTEYVEACINATKIAPPTEPGLREFMCGELIGYANVLEDESVRERVVEAVRKMRRCA